MKTNISKKASRVLYFMALAAAAFVTSCSSENGTEGSQQSQGSGEAKTVTLTATMEGDNATTRVGMTKSDNKANFYWHKGDEILLQTKSGNSYTGTTFTTQNDNGTTEATFSGTTTGELGKYAVYPGDKGHQFTSEKGLTYKLPSSYTDYKPESNIFPTTENNTTTYPATSTSIPMLGTITDSKIAFKHIGGLAVIRIDKMPATSGTLTVTADQQLSGDFTIADMSVAKVAITTATTTTEADKKVEFTFTDATQDQAGVFYLPLATGSYSNVTITLGNSTVKYGNLYVARASVKAIPLYNDGGSIVKYSSKDTTDGTYVINGITFVDLGLSSGLLWAKTNVGATSTTSYGNYYAWGETTASSNYAWGNYKWGKSAEAMTKYNATDKKTTLEAEDDAATINCGSGVRMPSDDNFSELIKQCTWTWTTSNDNNVSGWKISNKSDTKKFIFLPAAGYKSGNNDAESVGTACHYWTSTITSGDNYYYAQKTYFTSSSKTLSFENRYMGYAIRPVTEK